MKIGRFLLNLLKIKMVRFRNSINKNYRFGLVKEKRNIPYIDDGNINHQFDIYYASENRKNICLFDIHGGSYIFNSHIDNYEFALEFVKRGYDVITLDYLPNDGKMNVIDQVNDILKNIEYIANNLNELEINKDKYVLTGDSAGGHFALLMMELFSDKELLKQFGFEIDIHFEGVLVNSPVYDVMNIGNGYLSKSGYKRMFGPDYMSREKVSPKKYIDYLNSPIFLSTCKNDFLRSESLLLLEDLKEKQKEYEFLDIDNPDKKVDHVHNVNKVYLADSIKVNDTMDLFIQKHIMK